MFEIVHIKDEELTVSFLRQLFVDQKKGELGDYCINMWNYIITHIVKDDVYKMDSIITLSATIDSLQEFMDKSLSLIHKGFIEEYSNEVDLEQELISLKEENKQLQDKVEKINILESTLTELMLLIPTMQV